MDLIRYLSAVNNTNDFGEGSLRDAIDDASIDPPSTINFSVTGVINLITALSTINYNVIIDGPGSSLLTVRRSHIASDNFRIFTITTGDVSISGLTVSDGNIIGSDDGGG